MKWLVILVLVGWTLGGDREGLFEGYCGVLILFFCCHFFFFFFSFYSLFFFFFVILIMIICNYYYYYYLQLLVLEALYNAAGGPTWKDNTNWVCSFFFLFFSFFFLFIC